MVPVEQELQSPPSAALSDITDQGVSAGENVGALVTTQCQVEGAKPFAFQGALVGMMVGFVNWSSSEGPRCSVKLSTENAVRLLLYELKTGVHSLSKAHSPFQWVDFTGSAEGLHGPFLKGTGQSDHLQTGTFRLLLQQHSIASGQC